MAALSVLGNTTVEAAAVGSSTFPTGADAVHSAASTAFIAGRFPNDSVLPVAVMTDPTTTDRPPCETCLPELGQHEPH
jgi:hypothetical protein